MPRAKLETAFIGRYTLAALDAAPDAAFLWLGRALFAWILRDELPKEIPPEHVAAWTMIREESAYVHDARKTDIVNGSKGGRPKKETQGNPRKPKETQGTETETKKEIENKIESITLSDESGARAQKTKRETFPPPATVAEVVAFCREKKIIIDASRFVNYFAAQGWKLANGNKMKDWHAAVLNWHERDRSAKSPSTPTTPTLRNETGLTAYRPADGIDCKALGI